MVKLIASDLDGTLLLNGAQKLPEDIFPLIHRLKEMGILFVAASGRQYPNMKRLFQPVVDDIAFICENGAMAVQDEKVLYMDVLEKEQVMRMVQAAYEKEGTEFTCATREFYYLRPKSEHFMQHMLEVVKAECRIINSWEEMTEPCVKVAVYDKQGVTDEWLDYWKTQFAHECKVVTSGNAWIDFIPFDTNKAKGIELYQNLYGIRPEECVVFGDEYNDIEMLQSVKYSFAMAHSKPGVRAKAAYQTKRVQEVLEKIIASGGNMEEIEYVYR